MSTHTEVQHQLRRGAWGEPGLGVGRPEPSTQPPHPCLHELRPSAPFSEPQARGLHTAGGEGQATLPHWGPTCWDPTHCFLRGSVGATIAGRRWFIPVSIL